MKTFGFPDAVKNLQGWAVDRAIAERAAMDGLCAQLQAWAIAEHEWQNDRPYTESTIRAYVVEATVSGTTLRLEADFDAGLWLELARDGRWAWLWPVVMNHIDDIKATLGDLGAVVGDPVPGATAGGPEYQAAKAAMYAARAAGHAARSGRRSER